MRRSRVFLVLIAIAAALLSWHPAHAQKITGTITGTVTDTSGAAVPGATVTITNTATNKTYRSRPTRKAVIPWPNCRNPPTQWK